MKRFVILLFCTVFYGCCSTASDSWRETVYSDYIQVLNKKVSISMFDFEKRDVGNNIEVDLMNKEEFGIKGGGATYVLSPEGKIVDRIFYK